MQNDIQQATALIDESLERVNTRDLLLKRVNKI